MSSVAERAGREEEYEVTLRFRYRYGGEAEIRQDLRELVTCSDMPIGWEARVVHLGRIEGSVIYDLDPTFPGF